MDDNETVNEGEVVAFYVPRSVSVSVQLRVKDNIYRLIRPSGLLVRPACTSVHRDKL